MYMEGAPSGQNEAVELQDPVFERLTKMLAGQDLTAESIRQTMNELQEEIAGDISVSEDTTERVELGRQQSLLINRGEDYIKWKLGSVADAE
jgi:hypothetical protein